MNKIFLTVIAMVLIGLGLYAFAPKSQKPETNTTASGPQTPTYVDVEIKLNVEGRDISGKLVFEFPNLQRCQEESINNQSYIKDYSKQCDRDSLCKSVHVGSCSSFVDSKYISMLNKQFSGSHYMHISDSKNPNERGVIAFWGLSDNEAEKVCTDTSKRTSEKNIITECL